MRAPIAQIADESITMVLLIVMYMLKVTDMIVTATNPAKAPAIAFQIEFFSMQSLYNFVLLNALL
jgi:hypothetical protein